MTGTAAEIYQRGNLGGGRTHPPSPDQVRIMTAIKISERDVARAVRDFLEYRGWRALNLERGNIPGQWRTEPGIADYLFIRYDEAELGRADVMWIEFKSPTDRRKCRCKAGASRRAMCTVCSQALWRMAEEARGGRVLIVRDVDEFMSTYEEMGW